MSRRLCLACGEGFTPKSKRQLICDCSKGAIVRKLAGESGLTLAEYLEEHKAEVAGADSLAGVGPIPSDVVGENIGGRYLKYVLWPDTHFPYHDERAVALGLKVISHYQPDVVFLLGDMLDAIGFGRFPYNVSDPATFLANELRHWYAFAEELNRVSPKSAKYFLEGNHEARIERWAWSHPQLTNLPQMDLNNLMKLKELGYGNDGRMAIEAEMANGELTWTHGTHTGSNKAGFAARAEMARFGTSGGSGHTHRIATYPERSKAGLKIWVEAGHMSVHQPHYMKTLPNWQQGMVIGEAAVNGNDFEIEAIPFRLSYKCRIGGKEFS